MSVASRTPSRIGIITFFEIETATGPFWPTGIGPHFMFYASNNSLAFTENRANPFPWRRLETPRRSGAQHLPKYRNGHRAECNPHRNQARLYHTASGPR